MSKKQSLDYITEKKAFFLSVKIGKNIITEKVAFFFITDFRTFCLTSFP